jgi:hypothetical protein
MHLHFAGVRALDVYLSFAGGFGMTSLRSRSLVVALIALVVASAPCSSSAQLAPTGGHYGGRASDTGFDRTTSGGAGIYSTSIPLDLPSPRGGLPIPLRCNIA